MKGHALAKVGGALMVVLGTLVPMKAKALPFEKTPEGFIGYANTLTFDGGAKAFNFFNPRRCRDYLDHYSCYVDYKETSALGTRTCTTAHIYYDEGSAQLDWWSAPSEYECSDWEKVATTPESQPPQDPQDPSAPSQTPSTAPNSITLLDYQILGGGAVIFLLGGGFGVLLSKLMNRK